MTEFARRGPLPVSAATQKLLDRYAGASHSGRWDSAAVGVILRHGSPSDADALLPVFLAQPDAGRHLVPVLAKHGDQSTAGRLLAELTDDGRLRDGVPAEVLHAVGLLGYEPAEQMLWQYAEGPYDEAMNASLGLLHLPCRGVRAEVAAALERHQGAALFPEFLPALAAKTGDPSWLGRLAAWGEDAASTDCNGGLILGIALHGDRARATFTRLLWDPRWEANGGGTGSDRWAYAGARVLGLTMSDLYTGLRARLDGDLAQEEMRHCLETFTALLGGWVGRPWLGLTSAPDPAETPDMLLDLLFEWSTPDRDDSVIGLASSVLDPDDGVLARLYELENELRVRAEHDLEIQTLMSRRLHDR
ncbi:hypothetical protein HDA40_006481 [Hamadaea flava]|uniref:HEAT repeat domain-containing protein n=1 Tax=Hamadaea flava TaxID=1742688 RepID=A0ABV8LV96_9ACTN|nr:hypothetical protein [Hamadaea flava]MCP2327974.1 hypothetical protein [Hamadaea flava]